jgi:hypothetical protein
MTRLYPKSLARFFHEPVCRRCDFRKLPLWSPLQSEAKFADLDSFCIDFSGARYKIRDVYTLQA